VVADHYHVQLVTAAASSPSLKDRLSDPLAQKALKYSAVSVVGVACTMTMLGILYGILKINVILANVIAVSVSSIPAYLLNRAWVWGKTGKNSFAREVLPFWVFAFIGLVLSTVLVAIAKGYIKHHTESHIMRLALIQGSNLAGFGVLWVARFFILDRLLFKDTHEGESFLEHLAEDAPLA